MENLVNVTPFAFYIGGLFCRLSRNLRFFTRILGVPHFHQMATSDISKYVHFGIVLMHSGSIFRNKIDDRKKHLKYFLGKMAYVGCCRDARFMCNLFFSFHYLFIFKTVEMVKTLDNTMENIAFLRYEVVNFSLLAFQEFSG